MKLGGEYKQKSRSAIDVTGTDLLCLGLVGGSVDSENEVFITYKAVIRF